ncbi:MAG: hypothetical protein OJF47_003741 [Nitrospira sp.]|jgi:ubiquinone/menaquinone biosynthesis C-methylase UbiE/uncharacterized protein YbaR (Trm112 family)|nr:MAG: hypothetical protein OJF47_003741 [Nitrospira sp.]
MIFKGIEICCPKCRGELDDHRSEENILECRTCRQRYPILVGIPDLRIFSDPYIGIEEDHVKGLKVADRLHRSTFAELVDFYYGTTSVVPPHHARQYTRGLMAAEARARAALDGWERAIQPKSLGGEIRMLEIGCGTAPLLVAAAPRFSLLVGVDLAFRWLVVAKKRLLEAGLDIPLVCACAEALPFPDGYFHRVISESSLEHMKDRRQVMKESRRVLIAGGYFCASTPNRWSWGPDPQVGVPAGGYWPKKILNGYVRWQGGIPPKRDLLSSRTLNMLLRDEGFTDIQIFLPDIADQQRKQFGVVLQGVIDLYGFLKRIPVLGSLMFVIGPLLQGIGRKPRELSVQSQ